MGTIKTYIKLISPSGFELNCVEHRKGSEFGITQPYYVTDHGTFYKIPDGWLKIILDGKVKD